MRLLNILRKYRQLFDNYDSRLLRIEISKTALLNNLSQFTQLAPRHRIAAVLKSNAYGHGLKEIGLFLDSNRQISHYCVDSIIEAEVLRDNGIRKNIMILGYVTQKRLKQLACLPNIILVINSLAQAQILARQINFPLVVHLKVDTGMHRQGMIPSELTQAMAGLSKNQYIKLSGLMTHLADADNPDPAPTQAQLKRWQASLQIFKQKIVGGLLHFAATSGTKFLNSAESNLIRLGLGLYGFDPAGRDKLKLYPALSFFAKIVNLKKLPAAAQSGYNFTYQASDDKQIAILPCGYQEGVGRALSNKGYFYYQTQPLKILGTVSMNLTTVDVSQVTDQLNLENEVEVYSSQPARQNSVTNVAKLCQTIPYEILTRLSPQIRRYLV